MRQFEKKSQWQETRERIWATYLWPESWSQLQWPHRWGPKMVSVLAMVWFGIALPALIVWGPLEFGVVLLHGILYLGVAHLMGWMYAAHPRIMKYIERKLHA